VSDSQPGLSRRRLMIHASGYICCLWPELWQSAQSASGTKTLRFSDDYPLGELSIVPEGARPWELAGNFVSQALGTSTFPAQTKVQLQLGRNYEKSSAGLSLLSKDSLYRLRSGESRVEESWLVKNLPYVTDLAELGLRGAKVSNLLDDVVAPLKKLIDLNLSHTKVAQVNSIVKLPALKNLLLSFCPISDSSFTSVVLPSQLQRLEIVATKTTALTAASIAKCPSLTALDASYTHFDDAALKCLARKLNWADLRLKACAITDEGLHHLAAIPALCKLDLSNTEIAGLKLRTLRSIVELGLAHVKTLDAGICSVLAGLPRLRDLNLSFSNLEPGMISALGRIHTLGSLKVSGVKLSGVDLSFFHTTPLLSVVALDGCGINDLQLQELCSHLNLVELNVSNNAITDKSVPSLARCKHLRRLVILGTALSPEGVISLKQQIPNCKILGIPGRR
jgi:Leucine-rich repeat (LRR) protein